MPQPVSSSSSERPLDAQEGLRIANRRHADIMAKLEACLDELKARPEDQKAIRERMQGLYKELESVNAIALKYILQIERNPPSKNHY